MGAEDFFEGLGEKTGDAVEGLGGAAADGLDKVGWESGAEWVRDGSESVAGRLGAEVDERELGETTDPKELLRGSPEAIETRAGHLADFSKAFERVGQGMKGLDAGDWRGEAADRFREKFDVQPKQWLRAADACQDAGRALKSYAETVRWAQEQAREAVARWNKAQTQSERARDAHNEKVRSYNEAADEYNAASRDGGGGEPGQPPTEPGDFTDPGDEGRAAAKHMLAEARHQRDGAAREARAKVKTATELAPKEPSFGQKLKATGADVFMGVPMHAAHAGVGVVKGVNDMVRLARTFTPMDSYNISHPSEMMAHQSMTLAGLASTAAHPERIPMAALGSGWKDDPAEAGGTLLSNLIGTKGAGGAVRGAARAGMRDGFRAGAKAGGRQTMESVGRAQAVARKMLDSTGATLDKIRQEIAKIFCGDPVDVATGRVALSATDVELPALLPLVFSRRYESSYRAGRRFGPNWASTLDQRLEVDAEGVIFVCEDGSLLPFPHPAPGVPTQPVTGARKWRLNTNEHGEYTVNDPDSGRTWHFDAPPGLDGVARLAQIDDRTSQWLAFEYDDETGAPTAIAHSAGYRLEFTTDGDRVTELHAHGVQLRSYGFDEHGQLAFVADSEGRATSFAYDAAGRMLSWQDSNGASYEYMYDEDDRCIRQGAPEGHLTSTFRYETLDDGRRATLRTDSLGATTRYEISPRMQVVAHTDPLGNTVRTEYDDDRPVRITDPLGRVTSFAYDEDGRRTLTVRPDGHYTSVAYNELGLPRTVTQPDGRTAVQRWDDTGNLLELTDPAGRTSRFTYTSAGHLASATDPLGRTTVYATNAAGLALAVTDPAGATMSIERDAFGRPVGVTDTMGNVLRTTWTDDNKPASRTAQDGTVEYWSWDGEGNCRSHTDPLGATTRFEYGAFDKLAARITPDGSRYEFKHDHEMRLTKVINPQGLTWNYSFDAAGQCIAENDFEDREIRYVYDAAGQLVERSTATGGTISFTRDVLGRRMATDVAGVVTTYEYDTSGRLLRAQGSDALIVRAYDDAGNLSCETVNGRTVTYTSDVLGRRTSRRTPTGATSMWSWDIGGDPEQLVFDGTAIDFTRDMRGAETLRRIGEVTLSRAYDPVGRLLEQGLAFPGGNERRTYDYRSDGHLIAIEDSGGRREFGLDDSGRVSAVRAENWTEDYAYDSVGNQTRADWPKRAPGHDAVGDREYQGMRLLRAGRVRYEYDDAGRVTLKQRTRLSRRPDTWRYTWNAEDRLTSCITPDGTVWHYLYDPLGRRIAKQRLDIDGHVVEQTDFVWDGQILAEQITAQGDRATALTWDHVGLHPVAQAERKITNDAAQEEIDSRFFAIVTDLTGAPTELVSPDGELAWRALRAVWGATAWDRDVSAYTPLRFPGQYHDFETGLHYNHFRYYDPETARYASPDALGLWAAPNPIAYVDNPFATADPLGLSPCPIEAPKSATELRNSPGAAVGGTSLPDIGDGKWLHGTAGNAGRMPGEVARALHGRVFDNFGQLREAFWKEVAQNPHLAQQIGGPSGPTRMAQGKAPFAYGDQHVGKVGRYQLHHIKPIHQGGGVYDLDNILVVTPRFHGDVLDPEYHYR